MVGLDQHQGCRNGNLWREGERTICRASRPRRGPPPSADGPERPRPGTRLNFAPAMRKQCGGERLVTDLTLRSLCRLSSTDGGDVDFDIRTSILDAAARGCRSWHKKGSTRATAVLPRARGWRSGYNRPDWRCSIGAHDPTSKGWAASLHRFKHVSWALMSPVGYCTPGQSCSRRHGR